MQPVRARALAILVSSIALAAGSARATPIEYVFTPDASMTLGGNVEAISGSFFFDPSTDQQSDAHITLTGAAPYAGLYELVPSQVAFPAGAYTAINGYGGGCDASGFVVPGCGSGGDLVNFYFLGALTAGFDPFA